MTARAKGDQARLPGGREARTRAVRPHCATCTCGTQPVGLSATCAITGCTAPAAWPWSGGAGVVCAEHRGR